MATRLYGGRWHPTGKTLTQGGQGQILWVTDGPGGPEYLLKRLKNPRRLGRFQAEIAALQAIDSPRIPKVLDYEIGEPAYLVTEFIGPSLEDLARTESIPFDEGLDLMLDVVEAVRDAHKQGVVHRDIKPANVVVRARRAWLIDFGICQFLDGRFFNTVVDEAFGARAFAAPETELGSGIEPGPAADVYSLGKLLFWVLSGGEIFPREALTKASLRKVGAPRGVERPYVARLIQDCIRESPDARLTAQQLLDAIQRDGQLIRRSLNAVGARGQTCQVCGLGTMQRFNEMAIRTVGLTPANEDPVQSLRVLHCSHCGYVQTHYITGTTGHRLWEI